MRTPPPSTETFWVCVPRVRSSMCQVGHPVCMRACRSHLYAGRSAITKWILGSRHRSCQSTSGISRGRGLTHVSPSKFLQVMLDRLLSSSFYGPLGAFLGNSFVHYDITPLPANAPPPPSEPTNHGDSHQAVILRMRYKSGPITASFISPLAFEGKTSTRY